MFAVKNSSKSTFDVKAKVSKNDKPLCSHCSILGLSIDKCYTTRKIRIYDGFFVVNERACKFATDLQQISASMAKLDE